MAGRIAGITIEIGGDTSNLQKALKGVDSQLKTTQANLKDINKLLKMDPSNVELLTQKQKNLENAISGTKERLEQLKAVNRDSVSPEQWDSLQREIISTEQNLKNLETEYRNFGSVAVQQIAAAGEKMKDLGSKMESAGRALQPLSTAAAGALTGLGALAYKSLETADDLAQMSQQTGLTTDEIQKFQYASELVDVSLSDMTGALTKLKKNMTSHADTWERLGISVTNADGSMRNATDVFYDALTALSQISNETERDQIAMEIFGKSADSLAGIIDDGGASLRAYGDEAQQLGLIMSGETLTALNETKDTVDKMKATMGASLAELGATLATTFGPAIEKVAEFVGKLSEKLRNLSPETAESIVKILAVVAAISPLLTVGGKLVSGIGTLLTLVPKIKAGITLIGGLMNPATLGITVVVAAVAALAVAVIKNWDKIKDTITKTVNAIKNTVTNVWNSIKSSVTNIVNGVKSAVSSAWDGIKNAVSNAANAIMSPINNIIDRFNNMKSMVTNAISAIRQAFNFQWQLPHLSLPHISITYTQADSSLAKFLGITRIPHLSVQWYRKAYENAMMFTSPTVMATPYGMKGFGDGNGAEIVMGLNKLQELVGASQDIVINVYASQGMDVNQLADAVQRRLVALQKQREAAYA